MSTEPADGRADTTRQQILRAAAHQFARRPYHDVGLDDILAEAELTKGAMYFHFRSKHALAVAIIDQHTADGRVAVDELLARQLSGLETLIDFCYLAAVQDMSKDVARAASHLIESVGRTEGLQAQLLGGWITMLAGVVERAIAEGDVSGEWEPRDVARLIVSMYMGLRQASDLDDPQRYLLDLERNCLLVLAGILEPDRFDYFKQFIRRRTALAISSATAATRPE
ncbi:MULTISPECIES: TetR/AcrR family transcriptional regulator [Mycobacterium]|uniref:TetR family transcriptional regulator n=1 Tax=Mycobacterium kiyosense TaxID=2871094 RepID=A0A9P3Q908_9MYCO|nr:MULTISPECIES: TetR/AcrR family transcriptional regulator [Mycobacterium]BDB44710.1 TetR family transcriptional regulator [Mycobacterium kiyosense]BDE16206.1 TetR family transcriptional regulator [Mycobacterium sp. 20KCMC460]GLB82123.1 TetR family transcriptional regulator [Mycobacterium kiyosense]GLB90586.1 TetR family transcriptional regulator [Mycobacterium kiyosense]GLB95265.1 TetR family transcriptional regulator [Mycobacterium kiyosense]